MLVTWESAIHFSDSQNISWNPKLHRFTTLVAMELFWPCHIWSRKRSYEPKDLNALLRSSVMTLTRILSSEQGGSGIAHCYSYLDFSFPESITAIHTGHIITPVTPFISDWADSIIPLNSFRTVEQAIDEAYLNFQADFSPARFSSIWVQDSPGTPSLTAPLIPSLREEFNRAYNVPHDLTLDLERSTLYLSNNMSNPARNISMCLLDCLAPLFVFQITNDIPTRLFYNHQSNQSIINQQLLCD